MILIRESQINHMKMNKLIIGVFATFFFCNCSLAIAQIGVSTTTYVNPNPAQSLVNNVLLGAGVTASNITFTPAASSNSQLGFFNGVNSNIGLDSGIVLSTGNVEDMVPGNFVGGVFGGLGNDPDLLGLTNSVPPLIGQTFIIADVNDVAVLEFDFVPTTDTVKFRYVFGSDEYTTSINTEFNDVFGFFISGPGINGPYLNNAENIAVVPGTNPSLPITISSVQPALNGQYYVDNASNTTVALNGFTSVFTAMSPVICGETYHIRLAIADGSDGSTDSGVFLEALSFTSDAVSLISNTLNGDTTLVEDCATGEFIFTRTQNLSDTLLLPITISGTAVMGIDYNFVPDTIFFLPGQSTIVLPIIPVADGSAEGPESIIISFSQNICGSFLISSSIWIVPVSPIVVFSPDTALVCPNTPITLETQFSGGYPPYTIVWSTGETTNSVVVNPGATTTYYYTVVDNCYGIAVTDSITVNVSTELPLQVTGSDICLPFNSTGTLTANGSGGFPPYNYAWLLGGTFVSFSQNLIVTGTQDTTYIVQISDGCGSLLAIDSVYLTIGNPVQLDVVTFDANQSLIEGCGSGIFQFTRSGSTADTLYLPIIIGGTASIGADYNSFNNTIVFLPGQSQIQIVVSALNDGVAEGVETITISYNQIGCAATTIVSDSIFINPFDLNITANPGNTICTGTSVTFTASPNNGGASASYQWKLNGTNVGTNATTYTNAAIPNGAIISCIMTSNDVCAGLATATSDSINMVVSTTLTPAVGISANTGNTICTGTSVIFTAVPTYGGTNPSYQWKLNGVNVGTNSATYNNALLNNGDIISCVLTSNSSCASPITATSNSISMIVNNTLTPAVSITTNTANTICAGTSVTFTAAPTNGGTNPSYQWKLNGINVGTNSSTYTNSIWTNSAGPIIDIVSCIMTSNSSCTTTANATSNLINITVYPVPVIVTQTDSICSGATFNISPTNSVGGNIVPAGTLYSWGPPSVTGNITGGSSQFSALSIVQTLINPTSSTQTATYLVTAQSGTCVSNAFEVIVNVNPAISAPDFIASQTNINLAPFIANFTNNTPNQIAYNFTWFFGDGTTSNIVNPSHNYTADGIYTVTLLASENNSGCSDTLSKINYITCSNTGTNCNFQSLVSPSGPILACLNGTVELTATTNASNPSYQWYFNGAIIGGATQSNYNASIAGYYSVIIYENGGCPSATNIVYVTFNNPSVALPTINSTNTSLICGQDSSTLTTTALGALLWNTGATSNSITVTQGGIYTVTATYGIGCQATSQPFIINGSAIYNPGICMVTVDSLTNSNYIIWETPLANDIERFYIYKEGNQANVYNQIGSVAYDSLSEFNDINSNPQIQGYRYKIAVLDTCGGLTPMSNFHKTIHLQIFPGVGNNRQLSWSHYEGINFPSYEISRRLPGQNFQFLATLASNLNTYTDINPPSPNADYRVDIVLPQVCNSVDRAAYGKSKSNVGNNQAILTVNDKENLLANLFLLPNPSDGNTMLQWESLKAQNLQIVVTDVVGKVVLADKLNAQKGSNKFPIEVDAAGVYFVTIFDEKGNKNVLKMVVR
jgi:hypothetical protein